MILVLFQFHWCRKSTTLTNFKPFYCLLATKVTIFEKRLQLRCQGFWKILPSFSSVLSVLNKKTILLLSLLHCSCYLVLNFPFTFCCSDLTVDEEAVAQRFSVNNMFLQISQNVSYFSIPMSSIC